MKIKLWNLETNVCLRTSIGHEHEVNCLKISSDKSKLLSGSDDRTVRVWDISTGECLKTIDLNYPVNRLEILSSSFLAVGILYDVFDEVNEYDYD